jgi:hypothetical protein
MDIVDRVIYPQQLGRFTKCYINSKPVLLYIKVPGGHGRHAVAFLDPKNGP